MLFSSLAFSFHRLLVARWWMGPCARIDRAMGRMMLTMIIGGVAIVLSPPIGILLALGRRSEMPLISRLCVVFIEVVRGVPLITILFMANIMLPIFLPPGTRVDIVLRVLYRCCFIWWRLYSRGRAWGLGGHTTRPI